MEYALRIATPDDLRLRPAEMSLPAGLEPAADGPVTSLYFGTEFCQELLPGNDDALAICSYCQGKGLEAVLLTPMVTQKGLERLARLLLTLVDNAFRPVVVFNDWGVFELLREHRPALSLRMGRLLNRGLRDPRLDMQGEHPGPHNPQRGAGLRRLAAAAGVVAVESDADLETGYLGDGSDGLQRALHVPFTFVTTGRMCLEKAAHGNPDRGLFTRGLRSGCSAPCRGKCQREQRPDTPNEIWRAGNTVFVKAPPTLIKRHAALADRIVLHARPMP